MTEYVEYGSFLTTLEQKKEIEDAVSQLGKLSFGEEDPTNDPRTEEKKVLEDDLGAGPCHPRSD